jgi:diguanylate cyclase (GGDEF)-like protein
MKISGAAAGSYSPPDTSGVRRALPVVQGGGAGPAPAVSTAFLGLTELELTPAVQAALTTLLSEIEELRQDVTRLKAQLEEAEMLADLDALTPTLNRRALMRELHRVAAFSRRYGSPASLVYFDLDGFKAVNDRFGHAAGDAALQAVSSRLKGLVRESDIVARMGGDEFAVILVQADADVAEAKAQSLAAAIEAEPVRFGEWSAPLHLSYGVCLIDPEAGPDEIMAKADTAMYGRKRAREAAARSSAG